MIKLCVHPDADSVAATLAQAIRAAFDAARDSSRQTALMLAGGRTPKHAYQLLASSGIKAPSAVTLMISDDRYVPFTHPDSNFLMLKPFLDAVECPPDRQIMVNTTLPRKESAEDFGHRLDAYFSEGGQLDACFLGLGTDGHTASLFSDAHLAACADAGAIDVDRPDGRVGISASPSIIRRAGRIIFVVTGKEKQEMASRLLRQPATTIAGKVALNHPHVELWTDQEARPHHG